MLYWMRMILNMRLASRGIWDWKGQSGTAEIFRGPLEGKFDSAVTVVGQVARCFVTVRAVMDVPATFVTAK